MRSRSILGATALSLATSLVATVAEAQFTYMPAGDLPSGSGQGLADDTVYAPGMLFPMEEGPAYANSQVYNPGGYLGPPGGQCDAFNYSYPWRDNYCEIRQWTMPLCPSGTGHQGQDIRAATCEKNVHWIVAGADGTITNVGSYSVYLTAPDGTRYDYLHMGNVQVSVGQDVQRGDRLGMVSNEFGGTATTIHLHFNIRQFVEGLGNIYVPPYPSLVASYQSLVDAPSQGMLEDVSCQGIIGWAVDFDDVEAPSPVTLTFARNGAAETASVLADGYRGDLCENIGFCDHGLDVPAPLSLFDGDDWDVSASAPIEGGEAPLPGGPFILSCEPPALEGLRRPDEVDAWALTAFWDAPPVSDAEVDGLDVGDAMPSEPELWRDGDGNLWIHDAPFDVVRPITDAAARAWRLDPSDAIAKDISSERVGADWLPRPILLEDGDDAYLLDVAQPDVPSREATDPTTTPPESGATPSEGCGCRTTAPGDSSAWHWLVALGLGLSWRRRRRTSA